MLDPQYISTNIKNKYAACIHESEKLKLIKLTENMLEKFKSMDTNNYSAQDFVKLRQYLEKLNLK